MTRCLLRALIRTLVMGIPLLAVAPSLAFAQEASVTNNTGLAGFTGAGPVVREGFATAGDGGRAVYIYSSSACPISGGDGGSQIQSMAQTGCWLLDPSERLRPVLWGADPACGTAATTAWNKMVAALKPGMTVDIGRDCYLVGTVTLAPENVILRGDGAMLDPLLLTTGGLQASPYAWGSQIRTVPGTVRTVGQGARISGILFIKQDLGTLPVTTNADAIALVGRFGDTALTGDRVSVEIDHTTFLGYEQAIRIDNSGGAGLSNKARIHHNIFDAKAGIAWNSSGEASSIANNFGYPILTAGVTGTGQGGDITSTQRSGACISLIGPDTQLTVETNMCFGFAKGITGYGLSSIKTLNNRFENLGSGSADTGIDLSGIYLDTHVNYVIGYPRGLVLDAGGSPAGYDTSGASRNTVIAGSDAAIRVKSGYANVSDNTIQQGGKGLDILAASTGGIARGNRFVDITTPVANASTSIAPGWVIEGNPGYNPVGASQIDTSAGSAGYFAYRAGPSPETVYASASNGITGAFQTPPSHSGSFEMLPAVTAPGVVLTYQLGPNELLEQTFSGTLTMLKMVH